MDEKNPVVDKSLVVEAELCTGCRICELACSMYVCGEYDTDKSLIKVLKNYELDVNIPVLRIGCDFCGKCTDWCPREAIRIVDIRQAAVIRMRGSIGTFPVPLVA